MTTAILYNGVSCFIVTDGTLEGTTVTAVPAESYDQNAFLNAPVSFDIDGFTVAYYDNEFYEVSDPQGNLVLPLAQVYNPGVYGVNLPRVLPAATSSGQVVFGIVQDAGVLTMVTTDARMTSATLVALPDAPSDATTATVIPIDGKVLISTGAMSWISDGTVSGTSVLPNVVVPTELVNFEENVAGFTINGFVEYGSDGALVSSWSGTPDNSAGQWFPSSLVAVGNRIVFFANNTQGQFGLWSSDGTRAGTSELTVPGSDPQGLFNGIGLTNIQVIGGRAIFTGEGANGSLETFVTDGTPAGTMLLDPNHGSDWVNYGAFGARSEFTSTGGAEILITDGTVAGTRSILLPVAPLVNPPVGIPPNRLETVELLPGLANGRFIITGQYYDGTEGLWSSDGTQAGTSQYSDFYPDDPVFVSPPCFAAGTRIATERGELAVEAIGVGDRLRVEIADRLAEVIWVGRRALDCARHPTPWKVWPVRVLAGAFGTGRPHTDLFLSPDHALYVNEVLIPVKHLINGSTIVQVPVERVTYYHVELAEHDVVLAQGLPAESYLDIKDGSNYANRPGPLRLYPDFSARMWEAFGCARLVVTGPELAAARGFVARFAMDRTAA